MLGPPFKAGRRVVGIPQAVIPALWEHLATFVKAEPDALVFSGIKGGPLRRSGFNRRASWREAVRATGAEGPHVHDLRHTRNMIAAESGAGLKDLMARMGHDKVRAAMIYQHAVRGADKTITDAIDKHISGQDDEGEDGPAGVLGARGLIACRPFWHASGARTPALPLSVPKHARMGLTASRQLPNDHQMFDFGISGYRPAWLSGRSAVVAAHGRRLAMLQGRRLTRALLVWDLDEDVWFSDGLVLLDFEGEQVEIVHQKFDEISITWNTVDPALPLDWAGDGLQLGWRGGVPDELARLQGQRLQAVELLTWTAEDMAQGMMALGFLFPRGCVTIHNALDENGMEFRDPDQRYARQRLSV
ncbi:tyrosine-type recombinase/integrase [Sphaerisporangium rhizosphaerae]|uniref:Tyrosine-type recombinase/integrase n=1 Tax=Sphaerisporangium rhizosphaerae TaxID=2269375 RepID=A0ABW2P226_9ACTN